MRYIYITLFAMLSACQTTTTSESSSTENVDKRTDRTDFLFVGTYTRKEGHVDGKGEGIHILKWNAADQSLTPHMIITGPVNPSYIAVHPDKPVVYTVNEVADDTPGYIGTVQAYSFDLDAKTFEKISETASMGDAPCHISIAEGGLQLLVANYVGGSIASYSIRNDGSISNATGAYANEKTTPTTPRQEAGHAHMIRPIPGTSNILVSDLGTDELLTFGLDGNGALEKKHAIVTKQYGGPRHFDFHPKKSIVYSLNELIPSITSLELKGGIPARIIQELEIPINVAGDPVYSSAIKAHPNGVAIYAATRGLNGTAQNEIVVCKTNEDGSLSIIQTVNTEGQVPRDFTITPDGKYLIAGNQDSDEIAVYGINQKTGELTLSRADQKVPTPVCFQWAKG